MGFENKRPEFQFQISSVSCLWHWTNGLNTPSNGDKHNVCATELWWGNGRQNECGNIPKVATTATIRTKQQNKALYKCWLFHCPMTRLHLHLERGKSTKVCATKVWVHRRWPAHNGKMTRCTGKGSMKPSFGEMAPGFPRRKPGDVFHKTFNLFLHSEQTQIGYSLCGFEVGWQNVWRLNSLTWKSKNKNPTWLLITQ